MDHAEASAKLFNLADNLPKVLIIERHSLAIKMVLVCEISMED